ncbi:9937_t:CDS:2, partial [Racocetra persica]
ESNIMHDLDITIDYSELEDLTFIVQGGFGEVYAGQWKKQRVAAKFVNREDPMRSKDFERELTHLRESKNCEEYIIQFLGLSQEEREIGMPMDYIKIYERCWIPDPSVRLEISNILNALKNLKKEPTCTAEDIQPT